MKLPEQDFIESKIFWIDLFCGAGGTTTGIHLVDNGSNVKVVACVNHDVLAIESHKANHPDCIHFVEDVRDRHVVEALKRLVTRLRLEFPGCIINIWASLECTNYSKAKGGLPRDGDSRTLANSMFMYIDLDPDYFYIENVREFMSWGPLDEKGKPISKLNGRDYVRWCNKIQNYGYRYDWQLLNAADFGAYTSRERYFGQFAKIGLPINWPEQTYSKKPSVNGLFPGLKKWKSVRDVLDLNDEGTSIFARKKPLSEKTLERVFAGLIKFVAGGKDKWLLKYNSMTSDGKHVPPGIDEPSPCITCQSRLGIVSAKFLSKYYSGRPYDKNISIEGPAHTIKTKDNHSIVTAEFLSVYYGTGDNVSSIDSPAPTVRTKDGLAKIKAQFIQNYYSGGGQLSSIENQNPTILNNPKQYFTTVNFIDQQYGQSKPADINEPSGTITGNPKLNLVSCSKWIMDTAFGNIGNSIDRPAGTITANRKWFYLMNPQYFNKGGSIDSPCFTLIARMDKKPPFIVTAENGNQTIYTDNSDSKMTISIKEFMSIYGIVDIKMRMLRIDELMKIQGFPTNYILKGTQTSRKKFIGNSVETTVAREIAKANAFPFHFKTFLTA